MVDFSSNEMAGDVQVCVVSDQPLPNLLPILDRQTAVEKVVLLVTQKMQERAGWLERVLRNHGRQVVQRAVADHADGDALRAVLRQVLADFPGAILNATGGTKPMALIASESFRAANRPAFYVDTDNSAFWLSPPPGRAPGRWPLSGVLTVRDAFAVFGERVVSCRNEPDAHDGGLERLRRPSELPRGPEADRFFESLGLRAMNEAIRRIDDGHCGADVCWALRSAPIDAPTNAPGDEYDVVACVRNRLYLLEMKNGTSSAQFNQFLHKIDNLRKRHGLTARAALVTRSDIGPQDGHAQRAKDADVLLISRGQLASLPDLLARWLTQAT